MSDDVPPGAEQLRESELDEDRETSERHLTQMSKIVENWQPLLQDPLIPRPGSPLVGDDRAYEDYPTSQVAWTGIRAGIDAMSMFFASLAGNRVAYETGHRAVARAALAGASLAVFVLAPPTRAARTQNAMRAAYDDLTSYERVLTDMRDAEFGDAPTVPDAVRRKWDDTFDRLGKRQQRLFKAADAGGVSRATLKKAPTFRAMVDYAATQLPDSSDAEMRHALRLSLAQLNSAAHSGHWHAILSATHVIDTPRGTRARLVMTTTDLFFVAAAPMTLIDRAVELFRTRARSAY